MWKKRIAVALALVALLVVALLGAGRWWVGRAHPQTSGSLRLAGLDGPVEIRRDELGVPHIYATSRHDAYFAQGVVHAQDRLWQMDFQRRVGLGRLSELLGEPTVETDRFLRTIGTHRAAAQDLAALSDDARAALEAYADGVNAYMATGPALPLEYQLLQVGWEPWEPLHSLAWAKMMQWDLSGNWREELLRARLTERVGPEMAALLLNDGTVVGALGVEPGTIGGTALPLNGSAPLPALFAESEGIGSNAWVIGGARTETGRPLLGNDPHLGIGMPGLWYEVGLHAPELDVVGASLPGTPAVVIGHNADIAWGVTNLATDTQDLFLERVDEAAGTYEWQGERVPLVTRQETIRVKGAPDIVIEVRETRHGPLINDVVEGLDQPVAFRWRASAEPTRLFDAVIGLNAASTQEELLAALRFWDAPAQNVVYADRAGNIGYVATGELPVRPAAGGMLPQPGWSGEWEWAGVVPIEEMPQRWNPDEGYIVTANQLPFPEDFPYYTGTGWSFPARAERIAQLIEADGSISVDDVRAMQADTTSLAAQKLVSLLLEVRTEEIVLQRALEQLDSWNEEMRADLPGAGIFSVVRGTVVRELVGDELGASDDEEAANALFQSYFGQTSDHSMLLDRLLDEPDHPLWDDGRTPEREGRDEILLRALVESNDWLGRRFGSVPHEWFWSRLHTATFDHPLGAVEPLDRIFNRATAVGGDSNTVNANGVNYSEGFAATNIPSYRQVVDVGGWEASRMLHTTGQSGHPFHPHYDDMIERWRHVELGPMYWSEAQTRAASAGRVLQLLPGD